MVRKDISSYEKYLGELRPCIICNDKNFELYAKLDYFEAKKCKNCGMISVNPHLTEKGLSLYYENYLSDRLASEKTLYEQRKQTYIIDKNWISKFVDEGKVLDIGCSGGQFLNLFDPSKWTRLGIDIEQHDADFAKKEFGIDVRVGHLLNLSWNEQFNLVIMRGVIEHVSDPIPFMEKCCDLVLPGGILYITATPMGDSFAFYVYREKWILFNPTEHLHFFTLDLLNKIITKFGFELIDFHYQYQETPYANPEEDYKKIINDILIINEGKKNKIHNSVPFLGSMITVAWRKIQ